MRPPRRRENLIARSVHRRAICRRPARFPSMKKKSSKPAKKATAKKKPVAKKKSAAKKKKKYGLTEGAHGNG
jgi:hypothetical protein